MGGAPSILPALSGRALWLNFVTHAETSSRQRLGMIFGFSCSPPSLLPCLLELCTSSSGLKPRRRRLSQDSSTKARLLREVVQRGTIHLPMHPLKLEVA